MTDRKKLNQKRDCDFIYNPTRQQMYEALSRACDGDLRMSVPPAPTDDDFVLLNAIEEVLDNREGTASLVDQLLDEREKLLDRIRKLEDENGFQKAVNRLRGPLSKAQAFAGLMEDRLKEKGGVRGGNSWREGPDRDTLTTYMASVFSSISYSDSDDHMKRRCIDIANYAMAIVDLIDGKKET